MRTEIVRRGHVFENPLTKERAVLLTDPAAHPGGVLVGHLYVGAGGRVAAPHLHPGSTERFQVVSGRIAVRIGDEERTLAAGERAEVPAGVVHDWWQVGEEPAEVLVEVAPGERFLEMLSTGFGLARDGRVDAQGRPRLLQLAVTAHGYRDAMVFASPPPWVQRLVFGALSPIGRLLGTRPSLAEYETSAEVVSPAAHALGALDRDGRLHWPAGP